MLGNYEHRTAKDGIRRPHKFKMGRLSISGRPKLFVNDEIMRQAGQFDPVVNKVVSPPAADMTNHANPFRVPCAVSACGGAAELVFQPQPAVAGVRFRNA